MTKMFNLNIMNHPNLTSNLQKVEVEKQVIITRQQSDESRTIDKMCIDITKKKKISELWGKKHEKYDRILCVNYYFVALKRKDIWEY